VTGRSGGTVHEQSFLDAGASVEAALECAHKTFRVGETVRQWWGRAVAKMGQPANSQEVAKEGPTDDLYGDDILWSERQADLLRRRAAGASVDDAALDWPNIAEAIASMGRSELRSCRSLLRQALRCMLKAEGWPLSRAAPLGGAALLPEPRDAWGRRKRLGDQLIPRTGAGTRQTRRVGQIGR
jgi:hypothetical protein